MQERCRATWATKSRASFDFFAPHSSLLLLALPRLHDIIERGDHEDRSRFGIRCSWPFLDQWTDGQCTGQRKAAQGTESEEVVRFHAGRQISRDRVSPARPD